VRFNDFLFAAHGAVMCVIIYSQFFPRIWGFTVGRTQRVSRAVLAIFWGLVAGVLIVALLAIFLGERGGGDARYWAWIDVVSANLIHGSAQSCGLWWLGNFLESSKVPRCDRTSGCYRPLEYCPRTYANLLVDLRPWIRKAYHCFPQIHSPSVDEL
jgi:hypothetical protein